MKILAVVLCLGLTAFAEETRVNAKDVPAPVLAAAGKAYPKAQIKGWEKNIEKGTTTYEVTMTDGAAKWQVAFEPGGDFVAREESIPLASLPAAVQDAIKTKNPKATLRSAEKITRAKTTEYEVGLRNAAKKEVTLAADGKSLAEE